MSGEAPLIAPAVGQPTTRLSGPPGKTTLIKGKRQATPLPLLPRSWRFVMKTPMSRFHIHDDLTAPEGVAARPQGCAGHRAGSSPTSSACSPARRPRCARYARFRSELRHGTLRCRRSSGSRSRSPTHFRSKPGHRAARARGPRRRPVLDEIALAARLREPRREAGGAAALPQGTGRAKRPPADALHEEAREAGWDDEQILEAIALRARWRASPRSSTSPARSRSTAPSRSRRECLRAA